MIYFLNENPNPSVVGDLEAHRDERALLTEIEPWYVSVGHLVFNVEGECFRIVQNNGVLSLQKIRSKVTKNGVFDCMHYLLAGCSPHHPLKEIEFELDFEDYQIE